LAAKSWTCLQLASNLPAFCQQLAGEKNLRRVDVPASKMRSPFWWQFGPVEAFGAAKEKPKEAKEAK